MFHLQDSNERSPMFTYDHHTLLLFGVPVFTLVIGTLLGAALAGLAFGVFRWKQRSGKIVAIASALVLLGFALATVLVLITVASGSMG